MKIYNFLAPLSLAACAAVQAAENRCPALPVVAEMASTSEWQNARFYLAEQLQHCLQDTHFFALYGASLMRTGALEQSIEMLERSLLLDPSNGAALVDYAEAMYHAGKLDTALELNRQLLAREDLPRPLEQLLKRRVARLESESVSWSQRFSVSAGFDDNLNIAADIDELNLTVDNQQVLVGLDEGAQPQEGAFANFQLGVYRVNSQANFQSRGYASVQSRQSELSSADIDQLNFGYQQRYQTVYGDVIWQTDNRYFIYGDEDQFFLSEASVRHQWEVDTCGPYIAVNAKALWVLDQSVNNDLSLSLTPGMRCKLGTAQADLSVDFINSQAQGERAGGDRTGYDIELSLQQPIAKGMLFASISYGHMNDAEGYSPLFDNNRQRENINTRGSLQYVLPVDQTMTLQFAISHQRQNSNLELFKTESTNVSAGISVLF